MSRALAVLVTPMACCDPGTLRRMRAGDDDPGDEPERVDWAELVRRARDGDPTAKGALVENLKRLVWHTIAEFGLSKEDREDIFAGTFCRMFERLDSIRQPDRLPGWVATTARNEAHTLLRARGRLVVSDDLGDSEDVELPIDDALLDEELNVALRAAFESLPPGCRKILRLLFADSRLSYEDIGEQLDMPHGSIGPTRQRCLDRLRNSPHLRPFLEGGQP